MHRLTEYAFRMYGTPTCRLIRAAVRFAAKVKHRTVFQSSLTGFKIAYSNV